MLNKVRKDPGPTPRSARPLHLSARRQGPLETRPGDGQLGAHCRAPSAREKAARPARAARDHEVADHEEAGAGALRQRAVPGPVAAAQVDGVERARLARVERRDRREAAQDRAVRAPQRRRGGRPAAQEARVERAPAARASAA